MTFGWRWERTAIWALATLRNNCSSYAVFFFSSRGRHTSYIGDWSSDVCSSDLARVRGDEQRRAARAQIGLDRPLQRARLEAEVLPGGEYAHLVWAEAENPRAARDRRVRSEERRVGKEWRPGWAPEESKNQTKRR